MIAKKILIFLIFSVVVAGIVVFLMGMSAKINNEILSSEKIYLNEQYGFSFSYPGEYYLEEKEVGTDERYHYSIVLTEDTEENREVREGRAMGREEPVAITIDVYQNNIDRLSLVDWLTKTNQSNFKLSDKTYASTTVDKVEAVQYAYDGLYQADVVAFSNAENIFALTVTYIGPEDKIRDDFEKVLSTFELRYR